MGKGAMGLFGANMADFQLGLAMDDKAGGYLETDEEIAQDDDPRVPPCRDAFDARRLDQRRRWVVSFSILSAFGRDARDTRRAGSRTSRPPGSWPARILKILRS